MKNEMFMFKMVEIFVPEVRVPGPVGLRTTQSSTSAFYSRPWR